MSHIKALFSVFYINIAFCSYLQFTQYSNIFGTVTYHIYIYLKS